MPIYIRSIAAENLRGYQYTNLTLGKLVVLVGENNEGKSSLLKMLARLLSIPDSFWNEGHQVSKADLQFWYPANNARHRARRFTLGIEFSDGREARPFRSDDHRDVQLRFAIDSSGRCRLNLGAPKRGETHDQKAQKLLQLLKEGVLLHFSPPVRDAGSSRFAEKLTQDVRDRVRKKLSHSKQAGAPKEYREAKDVIRKLEDIITMQQGKLRVSGDSPLSAMLKSSEVRVELSPSDILSLIESNLSVHLSTGDHDSLKVFPSEVGNGLQSLIDISLTLESIKRPNDRSVFVIVEEPEAFLHPSAQRQFMQYLRRALSDRVDTAILTTHSPFIVDEARYEEIVLVRNQRHFAPTEKDANRASINTTLMTAGASEVFFARTVVFVEGEGDRAFFNSLFKRIKEKISVSPELAGLVFQATGGCTFFAPWLRLARSYRQGGMDPFSCIWVMDGDAASNQDGHRPVLRASNDCGFGLGASDTQSIIDFGDLDWAPSVRVPDCAKTANARLECHGGHLFACDLEWAMFNFASDETAQLLKTALRQIGIIASENMDSLEVARKLGSKVQTGRASDGAKKQPFIRSVLADSLPLAALPPEIFTIVRRILDVCFRSASKAATVEAACGLAMKDSTP
jgi:predicted ATPase